MFTDPSFKIIFYGSFEDVSDMIGYDIIKRLAFLCKGKARCIFEARILCKNMEASSID